MDELGKRPFPDLYTNKTQEGMDSLIHGAYSEKNF